MGAMFGGGDSSAKQRAEEQARQARADRQKANQDSQKKQQQAERGSRVAPSSVGASLLLDPLGGIARRLGG